MPKDLPSAIVIRAHLQNRIVEMQRELREHKKSNGFDPQWRRKRILDMEKVASDLRAVKTYIAANSVKKNRDVDENAEPEEWAGIVKMARLSFAELLAYVSWLEHQNAKLQEDNQKLREIQF